MLETSPYLRQHAHNPVNWHPWGEEALAATLAMQVAKPAPMLADLAPGRPWTDEIEALMRRALAKEPHARFATAEQFLAALNGITLMIPGGTVTQISTKPRMSVSKTALGDTIAAVPSRSVTPTAPSRTW